MHPVDLGPAPGLATRPDDPRGTVLLLHGQYVDALSNSKELESLAGAGWAAVGIDAPRHGRRFDDDRDAAWADGGILDDVIAAGAEMPAIVDALQAQDYPGPYGIVGISLGALTSWVALAEEPRLRVACPILGTPEIERPGSAHHRLDDLADRAILAQNAGLDDVIPLEPTRWVVEELQNRGANAAMTVYPRSGHMLRELDWNVLWDSVHAWLNRFLR